MSDTIDHPSTCVLAATDDGPLSAANTRILVASHGHPLLAKGGSEIAAYRLFCELSTFPGCEVWFLGCGREPLNGPPITQPFSEREFVYWPQNFEWFILANRDLRFPAELEQLVGEMAPGLVHLHHYASFGIEVFYIIKRVAPRTKIVLTLHEFSAICGHFGQMITRNNHQLCYRATLRDCVKCFPERDTSMFFVRELYIKRLFERVDHFVSPSRFLKDRYVDWGIPEAKISVLPNVVALSNGAAAEATPHEDGLFRVGFFGQLSVLKGTSILLEAARLLELAQRRDIIVEVHGDGSNQPPEFQEEFAAAIAKAGSNVRFYGRYDETQVDQLMQGVDVVVVPSIWWENAPVVIEEALRNGRPVICSNIGGMAEAVRDGVDGFHFPVGNATALARLLERLADTPDQLATIRNRMRVPPVPSVTVRQHVELYRRLLEEDRRA